MCMHAFAQCRRSIVAVTRFVSANFRVATDSRRQPAFVLLGDENVISHGTIVLIRVKKGEVCRVWQNGSNPVILEPQESFYVFNSVRSVAVVFVLLRVRCHAVLCAANVSSCQCGKGRLSCFLLSSTMRPPSLYRITCVTRCAVRVCRVIASSAMARIIVFAFQLACAV